MFEDLQDTNICSRFRSNLNLFPSELRTRIKESDFYINMVWARGAVTVSKVCVGAVLICFKEKTGSDLVFFLPESRNTNVYLTDPTRQRQGQRLLLGLG